MNLDLLDEFLKPLDEQTLRLAMLLAEEDGVIKRIGDDNEFERINTPEAAKKFHGRCVELSRIFIKSLGMGDVVIEMNGGYEKLITSFLNDMYAKGKNWNDIIKSIYNSLAKEKAKVMAEC